MKKIVAFRCFYKHHFGPFEHHEDGPGRRELQPAELRTMAPWTLKKKERPIGDTMKSLQTMWKMKKNRWIELESTRNRRFFFFLCETPGTPIFLFAELPVDLRFPELQNMPMDWPPQDPRALGM